MDSINLGVGLIRVSRKGSPSVPGSSMANLHVQIYGIEVVLTFVNLIFTGGTVNIINIHEPPLD